MNVKGKLKVIGPVIDVTDSFRNREIVVTTDEQYPQHIAIKFVQDKCGLVDQYKIGEEVSVDINLRGREWINPQGEAKYFNEIQGWRIAHVSAPSNAAPAPEPHHSNHPTNQPSATQAAPQPTTQRQADMFQGNAPADDEDDLLF